jgi:signal transduction histidine kinase
MPTASSTLRLNGAAALDRLVSAVELLAGANTELEVADIVRSAARALTGADGVSVVLKKGDRVQYVDEDAVGPLWKGQDFPIEACISGWAILNKQTVVIEDITGDPRIPLAAYQPTFVKSLAMAPVGLPNPIAAIGAYWAEQRRPTDDEVQALESMARAAAVALENVRLRLELTRARDDAEAANRAKGAFLGTMSREIRAPLGAVSSLVDLLDRTELDDRQRQIVSVLKDSAEDVVELVCDILDFAQVEGGAEALYSTPFDLEATVRSAAALHVAAAAKKGIAFDIDIAPEAKGFVFGDSVRIQKVVEALAANAVKYTDQGAVGIRLEEEERVGVKSLYRLSVTDTGLGFDESTSSALFERFGQGDARGGLGLGLAMAGAVTRAMGGAISATALSGLGSEFVVRMPFERVVEQTA